MNNRSKIGFIVNYVLRTKPGFLVMGSIVLLVSGYLISNGYLINVGWVFIILAIIVAVILEIEVWAWKKVDKRHDGALSSTKNLHSNSIPEYGGCSGM